MLKNHSIVIYYKEFNLDEKRCKIQHKNMQQHDKLHLNISKSTYFIRNRINTRFNKLQKLKEVAEELLINFLKVELVYKVYSNSSKIKAFFHFYFLHGGQEEFG